MPMRTSLLLVGLLLPLVAACGDQPEPTAQPTGQDRRAAAQDAGGPSATPEPGPGFDLPDAEALVDASDVRFHVLDEAGEQVDLDWWTACLSVPVEDGQAVSMGQCSDGQAPRDPQSVGSPDEVRLAFDLPGWTFEHATFRAHGSGPADTDFRAPIEQIGERTFVVSAPDEPGDYDVDVFGRGPEGDAVTTFRWVVR